MMQRSQSPDNRVESPVRKIRLWLAGAWLFEGILIWWLRKLEQMPYSPPYDMSTLLGGPELEFVQFLISVLVVLWVLTLAGFVTSCWSRRSVQ